MTWLLTAASRAKPVLAVDENINGYSSPMPYMPSGARITGNINFAAPRELPDGTVFQPTHSH
ncbi:MAG: hypothetical protein ACK4E7_14625 [Permianibacter sp.]